MPISRAPLSPLLAALILLAACGAYMQGNMAMNDGDYEQAAVEYRRALGENPDYAPARRGLARALIFQGDYQGAVSELEYLLSHDKKDWEADYYLALARIGQGERAAGIEIISQMSIPFALRMKQELERAARKAVARQDLSDAEVVQLLDKALSEAETRQERRKYGDKNK